MHLEKYFSDKPYGAKKLLCTKLGITQTWLGLLISKKKKPSAILARRIEKATKGDVTARELRPDLFN